jgi:ankyrin repeat protein
MASIAAGCFIINGLPLCLVGAGVVNRWGWARVIALLLGLLAGVQGIGLLTGVAATTGVRILGAALALFGVLTWSLLLGRRAREEFSGMRFEAGPGWVPSLAGVALALVAAPLAAAYFLSLPSPAPRPHAKAGGDERGKEKDAAPVSVAEFHAAAEAGQVSRALECVKGGVHPDDRDGKGGIALHRAAGRGQTRMVVFLLAFGAQPNDKDEQGRTALMLACENGHGAVVKLLLGSVDAQMEIRGFRDSIAPSIPKIDIPGLGKGKFPDVKLPDIKLPEIKLPAFTTPPKAEVDARDKEGRSALMLAARGGHFDIVKLLTTAGAEKDTADKDWMKAWMHAGASGHQAIMEYLLPVGGRIGDRKATFQTKNRAGKTVYDLAAEAGHDNIVALMRPYMPEEKKAVVVVPPKPKGDATGTAHTTPLFKAIEAGDVGAVDSLLRGGAAVDGRDDKGRTALMVAAGKGDHKLALLLGTAMGNTHPELIDAADTRKRTALHHAASGRGEAMDAVLVVVRGAWGRGKLNWFRHVERKDADGKTAAMLATDAKHAATAEKIEAFIIEMLDKDGGYRIQYAGTQTQPLTALEQAANVGDLASVEGLLRRGARRDRPASYPTALMHAAAQGHILVARALLQSFDSHEARLQYLNLKGYRLDKGSYTAEEFAAHAKQDEVAALLAEARTKPPPPKKEGPATARAAIAPKLRAAIEAGDLDALQAYIDAKGRLDGSDTEGRTALMLAAAKGDRKAVLLLSAKMRGTPAEAETFTQDKQGRTAFHHAALAGQPAVVDSLAISLEAAWDAGKLNWFVVLDHKDKEGKTALDLAKGNKQEEAGKALEAAYKKLLDDHSSGHYGTAVELASARGDLPLLERLLIKGASVQPGERKTGERKKGKRKPGGTEDSTALSRAASAGNTAVVRRLLATFDKDEAERIKYVELASGGNLSTAVHQAAVNGKAPALELLLDAFGKEDKKRMTVVASTDRYGVSPLHTAASKGHLLVVQALLEAFGDDRMACAALADSKARSGVGGNTYTALYFASVGGHKEIEALLRKHGATKKE